MKELVNIQSKLVCKKNQMNKFGGYKYRSCEDILEAVKPLLAENECTLTITDDVIMVGDRIYVKAEAVLTNKEGVEVCTKSFAREEESQKGMSAAQITGSASSYARKYALNGLFCIDDTKDDDFNNTHGKDDKKQPQAEQPVNTELIPVLEEINKATDKKQLDAIYLKYECFQKNNEFLKALTQKKTTLTK